MNRRSGRGRDGIGFGGAVRSSGAPIQTNSARSTSVAVRRCSRASSNATAPERSPSPITTAIVSLTAIRSGSRRGKPASSNATRSSRSARESTAARASSRWVTRSAAASASSPRSRRVRTRANGSGSRGGDGRRNGLSGSMRRWQIGHAE